MISRTVVLYRILLLLLHIYYRITCGLVLLRNQLKRLYSDKQYRCTVPLNDCYSEVMAYTALAYSYWASFHDAHRCLCYTH